MVHDRLMSVIPDIWNDVCFMCQSFTGECLLIDSFDYHHQCFLCRRQRHCCRRRHQSHCRQCRPQAADSRRNLSLGVPSEEDVADEPLLSGSKFISEGRCSFKRTLGNRIHGCENLIIWCWPSNIRAYRFNMQNRIAHTLTAMPNNVLNEINEITIKRNDNIEIQTSSGTLKKKTINLE